MKSFDSLRSRLKESMLSAVNESARRTVQLARQAAPYGDGSDGGHLRDCIFSDTVASEGFVSGTVYADNPHAAYVEHGTSLRPPKPYLRPAFQAQRALFLEKLNS